MDPFVATKVFDGTKAAVSAMSDVKREKVTNVNPWLLQTTAAKVPPSQAGQPMLFKFQFG